MFERRVSWWLTAVTVILTGWWPAAVAQVRPLLTEPPQTVADGRLGLEVGFEFLQDVTFRLSGLKGDLTRVGVLGTRWGVADRVEIQAFWTAIQFLNVDRRFDGPNAPILDFAGESTSDTGNLFLATKLYLAEERGARPSLGFRFGVELPNSRSESGIGVDETNFHSAVLVSRHWGDLEMVGNLGLSILGDPVTAGSQDDLLTYGIALIYPVSRDLEAVADWNGRAGPGGIGTEEQSLVRLGLRTRTGGLVWDGAVQFGLRDTDPQTGIVLGLSYLLPK
ncbi:MAG: hypothetical protein Kow001_00830 [Acidobacteriota bacterium]